MMPHDFDPPELGNEDTEFAVLLTVAALNVAEAARVPEGTAV